MKDKIKRITFFCNEIPENKQVIDEIIESLDKTGISYGIVPATTPVTLHIKMDRHIIAARGRTEVRYYLKKILDEKKYSSTS